MTYVPLDARGWRLAMGLRPLAPEKWLEVDERRDDELALKAALLATRRDEVVGLCDESWPASGELLEGVVAFLAEYHPQLSRDVDESEHPLVAAARLVQEDLCVMVRSDSWRLVGACVCFPSRWDLAEKVGATLDEIHSPVPLYDSALATPTRAVFDRLTPERSFWRLNWTLLDSADLFQPASARATGAAPIDEWHFRVERQTIRRLEQSGAIVFTIRTYVTALRTMLDDESFAESLLTNLESAPEATRHYKGWQGVAERLRALIGAR
jgi:hypothetical protein